MATILSFEWTAIAHCSAALNISNSKPDSCLVGNHPFGVRTVNESASGVSLASYLHFDRTLLTVAMNCAAPWAISSALIPPSPK